MNSFLNYNCSCCNNNLVLINNFGKMPLANAFIDKKLFHKEHFFDLKTAFCEKCKLFQLVDQPKKELMFNDKYPFYSSLSEGMKLHFTNLYKNIFKNHLSQFDDPLSLEIGCNDGIFLENFKINNLRHIGIEPSSNVANIAKNKSINVLNKFFNNELTNYIIKNYGEAHLIYAANVICHIKDINSLFSSVEKLLHKKGKFIFEDPYLGDVIKNNQFDQIYDEHVYLFSIISIENICKRYNLEIVDCEKLLTHGGSMRYHIARTGEYLVNEKVSKIKDEEIQLGLDKKDIYLKFDENCKKFKNNFVNLLRDLSDKNQSVVGYAATSKSTTILNYCNISSEYLNCIFDSTEDKQDKFSPGMHIPIRSDADFTKIKSNYCILFAYNHKKEILEKEHKYSINGSKWIELFPLPKIIND